MKTSVRAVAEITTVVSLGERVVRLAQVRQGPHGPTLLALKMRPAASTTAEAMAALIRTLPSPPGRVILALPKADVLTRYLTLPAEDLGELVTMARYAVAESIPYAIQDCVITVQPIRTLEKKTRVLALIVTKQALDQRLRLLESAGLNPSAVAVASEGVARWHQRLSPAPGTGPRLVLETLGETVEMIIVEGHQLFSVRSLPLPPPTEAFSSWLVTQVQETLHSYAQERLGTPVAAVTVSGAPLATQGVVATLAEHLNLPVAVADPAAGPFTHALAQQAVELTAVPWNDLLGLAVEPAPPVLDLLPAEAKHAHAVEAARCLGRQVFLWVGVCAWLGAMVCGLVWVRYARASHALARQQEPMAASAARAQALARYLDQIATAQPVYVAHLTLLTDLQRSLSGAVILERIAWRGAQLTLQGNAATLGDAMQVVNQWSHLPALADVALQHATAERGGRIRFTVEARRR